MNRGKACLTFIFFMIISPLLLIQGQNSRFWDLSKFMRIPNIPSGFIIEKALYVLFASILVIYTPILFIMGRLEESLKYQYSLVTFMLTVIATLLYSFLLANVVLYLFDKGKSLLKKTHYRKIN